MKRTLALLLSLTLATTLAACTPSTTTTTNTNSPETTTTTPAMSDTPTEGVTLSALRRTIKDSGKVFAIIDLGICDEPIESADIISEDSPALKTYPFLKDIDGAHIVISLDGYTNTFCIVPADTATTITIYQASLRQDGKLEIGEKLYSLDRGDPIILHCTVGDTYTGVVINMKDPSGATVDAYMPFYSGKDGSLLTTDSNGNDCAYDATVY